MLGELFVDDRVEVSSADLLRAGKITGKLDSSIGEKIGLGMTISSTQRNENEALSFLHGRHKPTFFYPNIDVIPQLPSSVGKNGTTFQTLAGKRT